MKSVSACVSPASLGQGLEHRARHVRGDSRGLLEQLSVRDAKISPSPSALLLLPDSNYSPWPQALVLGAKAPASRGLSRAGFLKTPEEDKGRAVPSKLLRV